MTPIEAIARYHYNNNQDRAVSNYRQLAPLPWEKASRVLKAAYMKNAQHMVDHLKAMHNFTIAKKKKT